MKLNEFFINCLNRRSFQLLSFIGGLLLLCLLSLILFCILDEVETYTFLTNLFIFLAYIFPTFGLISILSIIAIYLKLLFREYRNSDYRIKNKFLTQNPIYGIFAFIFYIFAVISFIFCLYLEILILTNELSATWLKEMITWQIYLYPFLIYTLILVFFIKKI